MLSPTRLSCPQPLNYIIPTFTVTINPLEANEVTVPLPESPKKVNKYNNHTVTREIPHTPLHSPVNTKRTRSVSYSGRSPSNYSSPRSIANTTIIVDDDGNEVIQESAEDRWKGTDRLLRVDSNEMDEEDRR